MNDDDRGNELPAAEPDTTPPDPAEAAVPLPGAGWQMPEPKFQQSSGYLPQGYLDKVGFDAPPQAAVSGAAAAPAVASPPAEQAHDVEPQPEIPDHHEDSSAASAPRPAVKERSTGSRVLMIVLGLVAMAAFIAVFLGVVYYLFLAPQNGGSTF